MASPWDRQKGIRFFQDLRAAQNHSGRASWVLQGGYSLEKMGIHAFPWCFFDQRIRREEQPGCCHHTKLQAALGAWPQGKLELEAPGIIQNPGWGLLHPISFEVWKGAGRDGRQSCPGAASVGCLGSLIPCFPSAGAVTTNPRRDLWMFLN